MARSIALRDWVIVCASEDSNHPGLFFRNEFDLELHPGEAATRSIAMKQGAGGEIQLTDAIADEIKAGGDVYGLRFDGQRYDCGSKAGYLQATVAFALARSDLREEFASYIAATVDRMKAAE